MKSKHFVAIAGGFTCVTAALRMLQYLFVIDGEGYYTSRSPLVYIPYAIFIVIALFSLLVMLSKNKGQADPAVTGGGRVLAVLYIVAALLISLSTGILMTAPIGAAPINLYRVVAIIALFTAVFFAVLGISLLKNIMPRFLTYIGFLPPIYFCLYGVCEFYSVFERSQQSWTQFNMLSVGTLALFVTALCYATLGAPTSLKRVIATAVLYPPCAAACCVSYLFAHIRGHITVSPLQTVYIIIQLVFMAAAFTVLLRIDKKTAPTQAEVPAELDTYINDIPEETDE